MAAPLEHVFQPESIQSQPQQQVDDLQPSRSSTSAREQSTNISSASSLKSDTKIAVAPLKSNRSGRFSKFNIFKHEPSPISNEREVSREYKASFWSKLTFSWISPLIRSGYRRPLEENDVWKINPKRDVDILVQKLQSSFKTRTEKGQKHPLLYALYDTTKKQTWLGALYQFLAITGQVMQPFILRFVVEYAQDAYDARQPGAAPGTKPPPIGKGIGIIIGLVLVQFFQRLATSHAFYQMLLQGGQARAALISAIFEKAMTISGRARAGQNKPADLVQGSEEEKNWFIKMITKRIETRSSSSKGWSNGEIINLMSVHAARVDTACFQIQSTWASPYALILTLILLLINLGYSSLAGYAPIVVLVPMFGHIVNVLARRRTKINVITDQRITLCQEVFGNMRFVKFFGLQKSVLKRLEGYRKAEITKTQLILTINTALLSVMFALPTIGAMLAFITYFLTQNNLPAARIFSSLGLFEGLRINLVQLTLAVTGDIDAYVSIKRIEEFLLAEDWKHTIQKDLEAVDAIDINNAAFTWEETLSAETKTTDSLEEKTTTIEPPFEISNINLTVKRDELVAVIGHVACGKSSLLSALAGDMRQISGKLTVGSSTKALCSQSAWIQNTSVRQNITFGKEFNQEWFDTVVEACGLCQDIESWPNGDLTELGERGITVSGGQKQRINLARAIYFNADIILLDDPLSAVDAHVGRHIFEKAICGLLAKKCRILVTHQLHVLQYCDRIVWMQDGRIYKVDTYDKLIKDDAQFQAMMMNNTAKDSSNGMDLDKSTHDEQKEKYTKPAHALMQLEDRAVNAVKWDVYMTYFRSSGTIFSVFIIIVLLIFAEIQKVMTGLWLSWWTSQKFKNLKQGQYIGIYVGFAITDMIAIFMFTIVLIYFGTRASKRLYNKAVARVLRAPMSFYDTTPLGRILNRFSKDVEVLDNNLPRSWNYWLLTLSSQTGIIVLTIAYYHYFAVAFVPLLCIFFIFSNYYRASARELRRHDAVFRSHVYSRFSESVSGVATIRSYGSQEQFSKAVKMAINNMDGAYFLNFANQRWLSFRLDIIGTLLSFVVGILIACSKFDVPPAVSGLIMGNILVFAQSSQWLIRQTAEVENDMTSAERMKYYSSEIEQEAADHVDNVRPSWPENGEIVFSGVKMRYRDDLPLVLKGLTLHIKAGERIGIVGRTGAGKSSIMSAIFRLSEICEGSITIDGLDIRSVGLEDLRSRMAVIPQDPTLFKGTIRSNLDPFDQHIDLELWSALRKAHLVDETQDINDKYARIHLDSPVQEEGQNYSLGQRQLLALARALVRDNKIIMCDEATSSVDFETDSKIQQTILDGFKGRTLLCIAHRLKTIIGYDKVIVMEDGRIVEFGTPRELWDQGGIFWGMCGRSGLQL